MSRTAGRFKLPQPLDLKDEKEWVVIPRIARTIPFGYKVEEDDPDVLVPIPDELELLEKAKNYLKQYSYREVANWLSKNSGRYISHVGLRKRVGVEQQRQNKAKSLRIWAEYAQKAVAKAQTLEEARTGAKQDKGSVSN